MPQLGGANGIRISGSTAPQLIDDGENGLQEVSAGAGSLTYEYGTDANGIPEITTTYHEGLDDRLADAQNFLTQSQQASEDSAFGAGIAGFTRFAVGAGVAALNVPRLITSPDLVPGLVNAALHPINTISNAATEFINAPLDQKGLDVVNFLAFGGDKLLAGAGDFAVQGGKAVASFAGDVAAGQYELRPLFVTDGFGAESNSGGITGIQNPLVRVGEVAAEGVSQQVLSNAAGQAEALAEAGAPVAAEALIDVTPINDIAATSTESTVAGTQIIGGGAAPDTVTVYRVEGVGNQRIVIGADGSVDVPTVLTRSGSERNLFLNFGDESRAQDFLAQRLEQFPDNTIKSFEVPRSFLDDLINNAVPEADRSLFPNQPVIADPTKAANQFGLSSQQIQQLREAIIQGSGKGR